MTALSLPPFVLTLIHRLEGAGHPAYAVGGCVRDLLLGLSPHDYDLCTAALPEETEALFADFPLVLAGKKHGTVGVVTDCGVVEITTFRTEGTYLDNRHPDWVHFVLEIETDLARRDFTVNSMAYSPTRGFADPFGGRRDLQSGILRAVGTPDVRFREDALRILRGMRFSVRYHLSIECATRQSMIRLAPLTGQLARERVFDELCKLLPLLTVSDFLAYFPILSVVLPPLAPMLDFDQHTPHHAYHLDVHTAHVLARVGNDLPLRWAALFHDVGKVSTFVLDESCRGHFPGHAAESARIADQALRELKAPTRLRQTVVTLIKLHMTPIPPEKKVLRRWLLRLGEEDLRRLLFLQTADMQATGIPSPAHDAHFLQSNRLLEEILAEGSCLSLRDLAVNGHDLAALGLRGPAIGQCLHDLLEQVLNETLPNDRATLLQFITSQYKEHSI